MSSTDILEIMSDIKIKNSEGYDRLPQRIVVDGATVLINPLTTLFNKIYHQKNNPRSMANCKNYPNTQKRTQTPRRKLQANCQPLLNFKTF